MAHKTGNVKVPLGLKIYTNYVAIIARIRQ